MHRVLSILLAGMPLLGLLLLLLVGGLYLFTPSFGHNLFFSLVFILICLEKMWISFFRRRERFSPHVQQDWTTVTVSVSYAVVMYTTIIEYYVQKPNTVCLTMAGAGAALYLAALGCRYWTLHVLGEQWTVHLDQMERDWKLITSGPYRYVRHPLYLAACVEALAVPLFFGSYLALLLAVLVYLPFQIQRAYFEEKYLRSAFGADYAAYARRTWALFPLPFGKRT